MNLYAHQESALELTETRDHVAYYLDMGLGKTFVGSEKLRHLGASVNLIICQKSKIQDWVDHFVKYYADTVRVYDLTRPKSAKLFWEETTGFPSRRVAVINYELAWRRKELIALTDFTLMLDESSLIQNKTAKQTKFIVNRLNPKNVVLLSGTPCSGKYENLWTQMKLLGWDISEKLYLEQYVNRKLMDFGGVKFWRVLGYKNVDRLKDRLREAGAVFMKTDEVFNLPSQTFTDVYVDPPKEYKRFMKEGIVQIGSQELIGDTTLTKRLRARQLCSIYSEAKYSAFSDLLESTNDRLIVFYNFTVEAQNLIHIINAHHRPWSIISGAEKSLAAYENCDDSVTLVQYQAGSKGLNLQKANKVVYFSLTEKCDDWMQSQKRIHRIGQDRPCFYYIMKCRGTVEERIHQALLKGEDYTDALFEQENLR